MKNVFNLLLAVMATGSLYAQPTREKSPFSQAIETILGDFPYNYKHITGDTLLAEATAEHFTSTVILPGAESCTIGHYHSMLDTTASWQALMFHSEDFEKASRVYRKLFHELKKCSLKDLDGSEYFLTGTYTPATEEMSFATSELHVLIPDERYREFKVEVELLYKIDQWVVNINMINKKDDSETRPDTFSSN